MNDERNPSRDLHDHLAEVFLQDVGLHQSSSATPAPLDDEEFARIAIDLGLLSEESLAQAYAAQDRDEGLRLWEQLTRSRVLDVGDVLSVFRFHRELCSYSSRNVGRYFVVERLGEGASGQVYRAIHQDLLKHVALKILTVHEDAPRSMVERFRREAATAAKLRHPSIVGVHDVGVDGNLHYIAMDLVEGVTLSEWLAGDPTKDERLRVLEEAARAIGYAHDKGVLHRDLKPQNILVRDDGVPIVVDFGLARALTDATLTRDGAVLGTPQYMSPEQLRGEVTTLAPTADVYALGSVLYESLVGESPFSMNDAGWPAVGPGPPRFTPEAASSLGPALGAVCRKSMDPEPRYRYRDATELADELARVRGGVPVLARPPTALSSILRGLRRRARLVSIAAALLLVFTVGAILGLELLAENQRLEYAGEVKTAYTVLRAQLEPLLAEAESVRYEAEDDGRRAALLARATAITDAAADDTGVSLAYLGWIRWLVKEPGAADALEEIREAHPDNPFPSLVCAWRHLRLYADSARWPADEETLLHAIPHASSLVTFTETPRMKALLRSALDDLQRARETEIWQRVPELRWVEELCEGFAHYAQAEFEEAIERLERVGAYNDLPFEPSLILSFAHSRRGNLEEAFRAIQPLVERRPDHVTAARALASFYKQRAILAQRKFGDGLDDLREARRLLRSISTAPESDTALARLNLFIGIARAQLGEDATEEFERALPVLEGVLAEDPDNFSALGGLAQGLLNLGGEQRHARAAELADRMVELRPNSSGALELSIGIEIVSIKERAGGAIITDAELEDVELRITQAEERVGVQPTLLYYRVNLLLLRAALAKRDGENIDGLLQEAAQGAAELRRLAPDFHRAHFLAWWTSSYFDESQRPSDAELFAEAVEIRAPFVARGKRSPFDVQIAQRMEQLASMSDDPSDRLRFTVYAYELLKLQAEAEPTRSDWQAKCARLARQAEALDSTGARSWRLANFEHCYATAEDGGDSGTWVGALSAGVRALVWGEDQVLERTLEAGSNALAAGMDTVEVRFWSTWLERICGDDQNASVQLAGLRDFRPLKSIPSALGREANDLCWRIARESDLSPDLYARALSGMRFLAELSEVSGAILNTTGVLEVRLAQWSRAQTNLLRSRELNANSSGVSHPADAAFLAICSQELGEPAEAERWGREMQAGIAAWGLEDDQECLGFQKEVQAALASRPR